MIATICILIPPLVMAYLRERIVKKQENFYIGVVEYVFSVLALNSVMLFIVCYGFGSRDNLFQKLNQYNNFAVKFIFCSVFLSVAEPYVEKLIRESIKGKVDWKKTCESFKLNRERKAVIVKTWMTKEKIPYNIIGLLIVICTFLYLGMKKDIWFCDEVYTYMSANVDFSAPGIFSQEGIWHTGNDVVSYLAADEWRLNFRQIANSLYTDHVPLYFWLFRVASLINMGSCSKWIGLSINLVFYIVFFFVIRKLLNCFGGRISPRIWQSYWRHLQSCYTLLCCLKHGLSGCT